MKKISTLFALVLTATLVTAQTINETFENYSSTTDLTNKCWSLSGAGLSTTAGITGTKSLVIIPTTSAGGSANSNTAQIMTPYINLQAGVNVTFKIKLSNDLSTQATRIIQARLLDFAGVYSSVLVTLTLDKNSTSASAYIVTVPIASAGIKKLVLDITGNGDGNSSLFLDDIIYSSTYNYDAPYACGSNGSFSTLPVKLTSFSCSLINTKAQLKWTVEANETGDRFEIERSIDGRNFSTASVIFITNKIGSESYSYNETKTLDGGAYYRIKIINKDNSVSYSSVVYLKNASEKTLEKITLLQNNTQSIAFSFNASITEPAVVNLYNAAGIKMYSLNITTKKGANTVIENVRNLSHGIYILEVASTTQRLSVKLNK
ncbi:MAG: hypothetical protein ABR503_05255 [Chitinophagaceae bacterium]